MPRPTPAPAPSPLLPPEFSAPGTAPAPAAGSMLNLPPIAVVLILCAVLLLAGAAWTIFRQRQEITALRRETVSLTQAQRATSSRESAAAASLSRLAETEASLAKARSELNATTTKSTTRIEELDHLVTFLRGEVAAGQQTIERMKAEAAAAAALPAAPAKPAQGKR